MSVLILYSTSVPPCRIAGASTFLRAYCQLLRGHLRGLQSLRPYGLNSITILSTINSNVTITTLTCIACEMEGEQPTHYCRQCTPAGTALRPLAFCGLLQRIYARHWIHRLVVARLHGPYCQRPVMIESGSLLLPGFEVYMKGWRHRLVWLQETTLQTY